MGFDADDVKWLADFLVKNELVVQAGQQGVEALEKRANSSKIKWYKQLLHKYLFFKIPLFHPDRFLRQHLSWVQFFYHRIFFFIVVLFGALGGFLLMRQWAEFTVALPQLMTWQGIAWGGGALILSKICHELAHAFSAARHNCRVPTMGVAFMVMWPMLYSDLSDTWRLTRKNQRLGVAGAGMIAELVLALLATFLWSILPDGGLRDATFVLVTVTWITTLAINLNPFMRFDGYYLLADILGVENLQDRSFSLGKWYLREWFLGLGEKKPESFPYKTERMLILYAYCTWVYRFFLFLGIGLIVYYLFFKLLGIFLFTVEIVWFIVLPIVRELKVWWKMRNQISFSRPVFRSFMLLAVIVGALVFPWQKHVTSDAIYHASASNNIYLPFAAQLQEVYIEEGMSVRKNDVLFSLHSPDLEYEVLQTKRRIEIKKVLLDRYGAQREATNRWIVLKKELGEEVSKLKGLEKQQKLLKVQAPFDGVVRELDNSLSIGRWLGKKQLLTKIVSQNTPEILAYVNERDRMHLLEAGTALFIPKDFHQPSISAHVVEIADINTPAIEQAGLVDVFGGSVAVTKSPNGTLIPKEGLYRVRLTPVDKTISPEQTSFGRVHLPAETKSLIRSFVETAGAVLIRETGF
ncbi:biotin/lipoyl-binding protein [Terasakiella sp. SH-1]|uniref:HlyD family efflux transporter periplasmic adaptor subunit n=1 Tax=Terasakiella sp. SH-1 TaxID=2560057 RepID=UPI0014313A5E|nr:biotin/lipoyl-binding protein [Terasakiella sp. SH-1]